MEHAMNTPVEARLVICGWHGISSYRVAVVGMTPKRFRIVALEPTRLQGRNRHLAVGEMKLVPLHAVRTTGSIVEPAELAAAREKANTPTGERK